MPEAMAKFCLVAALLSMPATASSAAKPASSPSPPPAGILTIRKRVEEVQMLFTVQDGKGPVKDVTGDQLRLWEDGQPIPAITTFRMQHDLPLRVGLLVDSSESMQRGFAAEQQAARRFLERLLRPGIDSVFLANFSTHISMSRPASGTAHSISADLESMRASGLTALYDALFEASRDGMMGSPESQPFRSVIILLSDGEDNYSRYSLEDAIAAAQASEIVIYAITAHTGPAHPGDAVLRRLAEATGGRAFVLKSFARVDQIFTQMENELRSQYSVTFHPLSAQPCGYHSVELRHTNPRLRIHARAGYYGCRP
jgi:VWFA-related protein